MSSRSDERFFRAALAADAGDCGARLLLAEWLTERGDERAEGYWWMARYHKYPFFLPASRKWSWTDLCNAEPRHNHLPPVLYKALPQAIDSTWKKYQRQPDAEDELARMIEALEEVPI